MASGLFPGSKSVCDLHVFSAGLFCVLLLGGYVLFYTLYVP
jgi:hypothetical protein